MIPTVLFALSLAVVPAAESVPTAPIVVGSKKDVEGNILAEIMAQCLEAQGLRVERRFGLGSTLICFESLRRHAIDLYPEYSGTLEQEILKLSGRVGYAALQRAVLEREGMRLLGPFGFENTYALALKRELANRRGLQTINDLARAPDLRLGFSHEFLERQDGWPGLARAYGLKARPSGIAHGLAYEAVDQGKLDVTDAYSTDGDIPRFGLVLLQDDRHFFPEYLAAPLLAAGAPPAVAEALRPLQGRIVAAEMQRLNAEAVLESRPFAEVARQFLQEQGLSGAQEPTHRSRWRELLGYTLEHVRLTVIALVAAIVIALPLGILVYRARALSRPVVYLAGVLQTIPSIALLAFMIPLFGIGALPAIVALTLYALLPILRNTATALSSIDPLLRKVAVGMGLTAWQRLRHVELPLAAPAILAGVKTAAVITVGTATLAAFIGAGGLGQLIVTGLEVKNPRMVLEGALPAAFLAIATELIFEFLERLLIPRHLLQERAR